MLPGDEDKQAHSEAGAQPPAPSRALEPDGSEELDRVPIPAPGPEAFLDLLQVELPSGCYLDDFGAPRADQYKRFTFDEFPPVEGEYDFDVEETDLHRLVAVAGATVRRGIGGASLVKLVVSRSMLRARTYDGGAFSEIEVPLLEPAGGVNADQSIPFVVSLDALRAAGTAVSGVARFTMQTSRERLVVTSKRFERHLVLHPQRNFLDFDEAQIGVLDPSSEQPINPDVMFRALAYVVPVVVPDPVQNHLDLVEIRNGRMMGGPGSVVAVVSSPKLPIAMRVRHRFIGPLQTILPYLSYNSALYDTGSNYVVGGEGITFGFEKTSASFPPAEKLLEARAGRVRIMLPRFGVMVAMAAMKAALDSDRAGARFHCDPERGPVRCTFVAQKPGGERVRTSVEGRRADHGDKALNVFFPPHALLTAAKGSEATNMYLDFYPADRLLVVVEDDDPYCQTFIRLAAKPVSGKRARANSNRGVGL